MKTGVLGFIGCSREEGSLLSTTEMQTSEVKDVGVAEGQGLRKVQ